MKTLLIFFGTVLLLLANPIEAASQSVSVSATVLPNISYQRIGDEVTVSSNSTNICLYVNGRYLQTFDSNSKKTISNNGKLLIISNF